MGVELAQLVAIIRYEMIMQRRRRGLPMIMIVLAIGLLLLALGVRGCVSEGVAQVEAPAEEIPSGVAQLQASLAMTFGWSVALMLLILAVPPVVAEAIPKDRHIGVRELIDSLPLSSATYLTGKLLGVWVSMLVGLVGVAVLYGLGGWLIHGSYDLGVYLVFWIVGIVPLALFTSGMSALLPAGQSTRRRATFVGIAFAAYCVVMLLTTSGTVIDAVSLARPSVFLFLQAENVSPYSILSDLGIISYPPGQIPLTVGLGALQVALVWLLAWLWMRWKETI